MQFKELYKLCHEEQVARGWWVPPAGVDPQSWEILAVPTKLALIHSELSEALEGHRKGLMDDKLPQYPQLHVELADALIRLLDLAGFLGVPLEMIVMKKLEFNGVRPDHDHVQRLRPGGKLY